MSIMKKIKKAFKKDPADNPIKITVIGAPTGPVATKIPFTADESVEPKFVLTDKGWELK